MWLYGVHSVVSHQGVQGQKGDDGRPGEHVSVINQLWLRLKTLSMWRSLNQPIV